MDLFILMALAAGAIRLILAPPRWPRRAQPKTRADLRREWSQARPHWQGAEGWEGRE